MTILDPWHFIIVALCAFRVVRFLVFDSLIGANPQSGSSFGRWLDGWAWQPQNGAPKSWLKDKIANLLVCPWCLGFWITLAVYAAWCLGPDWLRIVVCGWALAGLQAALNAVERAIQ